MKVLVFKGKNTKDMTEEEIKEIKEYYGVDEVEFDSDIDLWINNLNKQDEKVEDKGRDSQDSTSS